MESTCSEAFLSASSDETECYLYPKRIKIESDAKIIEKEEQQKLEQSIQRVNRYQTTPHETVYMSERKNSWVLEKQSCDMASKTPMREIFHFQTSSNKKLPCRVLENKLSTKKKSPENVDQYTVEDDTSWNRHGYPLETGSLKVRSAVDSCKNLQVPDPPQVQQNNNTDQINKRNGDNELKQNSSGTPLNRDLFHIGLLSHKSVSDKKWKQYQLLQIPFLSDTGSVFSHVEHKKNNSVKRLCTTEDEDYSSRDNETTAEKDNTEKNMSSYTVTTLKPFKSIQPLEIPNFQFPSISNKINNEMPSTNLKEMDWKNFKGQLSFVQSEEICSVQKMSEVGKQRLQNDKSNLKASTVGSGYKEKNYHSISKPEHSGLAEGGIRSVTYVRDNSTDTEYDQVFAENYFRGKMLENSDSGDDQKSRIHIYISAKNVQNEECVGCNDLLKRMGRKNSNENMATFHRHTSFPVVTEATEKNELDIHCGVQNSNSDISLYGAESEVSTKEILDFKRYLTKPITFESNHPRIIVQSFPVKKVSCSIFTGKEMFKLKLSVQSMLFGKVSIGIESLCEDMLTCQDDGITQSFHFHETLNEQRDAQGLARSNISRSHKNKIRIHLVAIISKRLKVELLKTILASFFNSTNTLFLTEGKSVEDHPLCGSKQVQFNLCTDNTLRQNTEFHRENETYPGFVSSKFTESIGFVLHNKCQRSHIPRSSGEQASTFLKRGTLFHNRESRLCKGRHVRKQEALSRGSEAFSTCLKSVSHKNSLKKHVLVAKCLILLQGTFVCSSREKMYCSNITKIGYLIGANLRFWSYFPAHSQLKFEKVNSECTNQEISVPTAEQEKPSKMFNRSFHGERFKVFPVVLCENKTHEVIRCRNCRKSTKQVTSEVTFDMKKYLGASGYIVTARKECLKSKELQMNSDDFLYKKSFSVFDTYEKIPLTTDSEDCDQIPFVNQNNPDKKEVFSEENAVTNSKEVYQLPAKSSDVLILPEPSKTTMEKEISLLLQDSQTNQPEYCKTVGAYSPHSENKKENPEDGNPYLNFENVFPSLSNVYQSVTLPLDSCSFVNEEGAVREDGHCRSSSRADEANQSETIHATVQYLPTGSPSMTDTYLQAEETAQLLLQGHTQTSKEASSEPATLEQHLEYGKEQEEITDEQMHVTNESQCETLMNDLIMSYSESESQTFIAAEEELKMHLSIMNNGCLEDGKDKYLPLENKITYEFGLKRKFDSVLQELHMFHEISKGDENNLSSLETNSHNNYCELNNSEGVDEKVTSVPQKKICISYPICGATEEQNITDGNDSLDEKISTENEGQKVSKEYCTSRLSSEGCFDAVYKKPYAWDPAFASCTLLYEQNDNFQKEGGYFLSREVIRVQPLKTCKGPIRIGLSRKARPKQLHPYLK